MADRRNTFEGRMARLYDPNPPEDPAPARLSLPLWDVWIEGYAATGGRGSARCIARDVPGATFTDAARYVGERLDESRWGLFDPEALTLWGCALSPDEEEARSTFG